MFPHNMQAVRSIDSMIIQKLAEFINNDPIGKFKMLEDAATW